ncbi:MAG: hypothetical protein WBX01_13470 [Nitrososphaeraceae archaeon]
MTHNLIIRSFDDQVHEKLGEIANQRGVDKFNSKRCYGCMINEAAIRST